jgi:hypothetical protein
MSISRQVIIPGYLEPQYFPLRLLLLPMRFGCGVPSLCGISQTQSVMKEDISLRNSKEELSYNAPYIS